MTTNLASAIQKLAPSATLAMSQAVRSLRDQGVDDIIGFDAGQPSFDTPANITAAAVAALRKGDTRYVSAIGIADLRAAISEKLHVENHITAHPESVLVTPGAKCAIFLAFRALLEPGTKAMLLDPAWVSYEPAAKAMGAEVTRIPCSPNDGYQPDPDFISHYIDSSIRLIVLNSPCNPTGAVYEKERIRRIVSEARAHDITVVCDEIYESLIYDGQHYSPASDFDNVITVNGFSKAFSMTGWRLGYVVGPKDILDAMQLILQHSITCVTPFAQAGGVAALSDRASNELMGKMRDAYKRNRDLIVETTMRSEHFRCIPPAGTFYAFPSYEIAAASVDVSLALLHRAHVATVPGSAFGAVGEGSLRISFAGTYSEVEEGLHRMEAFFSKHSDPEEIKRLARTDPISGKICVSGIRCDADERGLQ